VALINEGTHYGNTPGYLGWRWYLRWVASRAGRLELWQ